MNYRAMLSRHRGAIMGVAALMILFHHIEWNSPVLLYNLVFNRFGNMGVDIFLFVSGFGLAYSLQKDDRFHSYYCRRLARVLPPYYAFLLVCCALSIVWVLFGVPFNIGEYLFERILPIGIWLNFRSPRWYIAAALGYYIIAALIYPLISKSRHLRATTTLILLVTAGYVPFIERMDNVTLAIMRPSAMVVGLAIGAAAQSKDERYRDQRIGLACIALLFITGCAALLLKRRMLGIVADYYDDYKYNLLCQNLMTPLITVLMACCFELLQRLRLASVVRFLSHLGRYSLEIYLVQSIAQSNLELLNASKALEIIATPLFCYPAARLLHWLSGHLLKAWRKMTSGLYASQAN